MTGVVHLTDPETGLAWPFLVTTSDSGRAPSSRPGRPRGVASRSRAGRARRRGGTPPIAGPSVGEAGGSAHHLAAPNSRARHHRQAATGLYLHRKGYPMSDTLHIPDDRLTESILGFIEDSPLSYCTTVGYDGGSRVVRTDRPVSALSTSERLLWGLLESVTRGDLRALIDHADDRTIWAITDLFAGFEMTGRAA